MTFNLVPLDPYVSGLMVKVIADSSHSWDESVPSSVVDAHFMYMVTHVSST